MRMGIGLIFLINGLMSAMEPSAYIPPLSPITPEALELSQKFNFTEEEINSYAAALAGQKESPEQELAFRIDSPSFPAFIAQSESKKNDEVATAATAAPVAFSLASLPLIPAQPLLKKADKNKPASKQKSESYGPIRNKTATEKRKRNNQKVQCPTCSKEMFASSLQMHQQRKHQKTVLFLCNECSHGGVNKSDIVRHWFSAHLAKTDCSECHATQKSPKIWDKDNAEAREHIREAHVYEN